MQESAMAAAKLKTVLEQAALKRRN